MRLLRALGTGLITGVVGMFLALFASDYLTKLYHVSNMEGQRGYAVVFLFAPLGTIVGFIVALVVSLRIRDLGFKGFAKAQLFAVLVTTSIAAIVSGVLYLAADKPPTIDGKELTLDFELRIPPTIQLPLELTDYTIRASLYASNRDNRYAKIGFHSISPRDGFTIVPGTAALMSHSANRELLASIGNEPHGTQLIPLKLPARLRKENEAWSDWTFATQHTDLSLVPESERIAARYRVRAID
jgi:MFS family permease